MTRERTTSRTLQGNRATHGARVRRWGSGTSGGRVFNKASLQHEQYALEVAGMEALLVSAEPARPAAVRGMPVKRYYNEADVGKVFLTRFENVSKRKAPL